MGIILQALQDTGRITIGEFKQNLFMWEIIITAIVFVAAYYVLKGYKKKQDQAKENNKKYKKIVK
jgi:hypothetical protein